MKWKHFQKATALLLTVLVAAGSTTAISTGIAPQVFAAGVTAESTLVNESSLVQKIQVITTAMPFPSKSLLKNHGHGYGISVIHV